MKQTIMSAGLHSIDRFQVHISLVPLYYIVLKNNPLRYTIRRWYSECHVSYYVPISFIHFSPSWAMVRSSLCCSYVYTMVLFILRADDLIPFVDLGEPGRFSVETRSRTGIHLIFLVCPNFAWEGG